MSKMIAAGKEDDNHEEEDDAPLPGFRFHPTDEELVGFYLKRKIEKRALSIEIIKQVDIYKFDPWDLPEAGAGNNNNNIGEKEWYFFCKRGRKYRNSIRPNRVTGSGFWKATGIDKSIYSTSQGEGDCIVGLKKSLVYYRGSAGKGTKTDWMMHEFRLPPPSPDKGLIKNMLQDAKSIAREAEVWTLCRILKRNPCYRKLMIPDWREVAAERSKKLLLMEDANSKTCSIVEESSPCSGKNSEAALINYQQELMEKKPLLYHGPCINNFDPVHHNVAKQHFEGHDLMMSSPLQGAPSLASSSRSMCDGGHIDDDDQLLIRHNADWEDLQSVVDAAAASSLHSTN